MNVPERQPKHRRETASAPETSHGIDRRRLLQLSALGVITLAGLGTYAVFNERNSAEAPSQNVETFVQSGGESLLNMHEVDPKSQGWMYRTAIQAPTNPNDAPHYQTDRDVGASSVGMGFLSLAKQYPGETRWLNAAEKTATWLTSVSKEDGKGGRYWNDYVANGESTGGTFTSFDDGAIGIGDFYWQLYEQTNNTEYRDMALSSVRWTIGQAETVSSSAGPEYRWKWDTSDPSSEYYTGLGMGSAGIVNALADFYARVKDSDPTLASTIKQYAEGGARYLNATTDSFASDFDGNRPLPETAVKSSEGGTALNSGYLSGTAGLAYVNLKLHKVFGTDTFLSNAKDSLNWLTRSSNNDGPLVTQNGGDTWLLTVDPEDTNDTRNATGFEEGNAGIGWTFLQAYKATGDKSYLTTASRAADWLMSVAKKDGGGMHWAEDENSSKVIYHANLNNGAAGVGAFLHDVYVATGDKKYADAANSALAWIMAQAKTDNNGLYWNDNDGDANYSKDPSWHWGTAGILNAAIRINGGTLDIPGEQLPL